ncbi:hypothetical protein LX73_2052 [Fodinibius salinus]|uniref:HD/PDEase domain-containing protein n=1 Tax=Fodinibius salinus TaxID=860790 RepID=A0A5D3YHK7_9BACT|nr:HDIG domain-containing metalloprotein [Fodinibius salinus]TYP92689.1 hypothetical protein LX73_2052 [Fodinibius salinus]
MSILEKLGLAPKKQRGAPVIGENKKEQEEASSLKYNRYIRASILLVFLGVLVISVPQSSFNDSTNYKIDEPWRADDLTAPFTFPIKKSAEEVEKEREAIRKSTPPIFHVDNNANVQVQNRLDSLFQYIKPLATTYEEWQSAKKNEETDASQDSIQVAQLKKRVPVSLSDEGWQTLLENYDSIQSQNRSSGNEQSFTDPNLKNQLSSLTSTLLDDGIINRSKSELDTDEITVRDLGKSTERTLNLVNVRDMDEAREFAQYRISRNFYEALAQVGAQLFNYIIQPNYIYNKQETENRINEAIADISTSKGAVAQGQVIIRRGDIITQKKYNMLQSLAQARSKNATTLERWLGYGGNIIAIISILTIFFFYLYLYRRYIFSDNSMLLLVLIAMAIICVASSVVFQIDNISPYIVPVAIAPIILTIIFDSRVGLMCTVTLGLLTGLINGSNFEYVTATIVACSLGLFSVRDIKNRSQFFFTTPGIVFISYLAVIIGFSMSTFDGWGELGTQVLYVGINAIFILFTYPLILLFEKTFNVTTDFTLLELSDTNLPLLKQLMNKAPGTFHHSLQVSNLAEAAAGAISANSLLCRVGGLYHDIGKMENPGYFTENQTEVNEHEKLKPRMSALVIKAHVSNGVKLAEEHGLPDVIIDFIKTHHGTSLIKFFWEKAKEKADADKKEIREEDFRYDGPPPQTKETGILLLADCVEASSRAMKDPNYQKLENLIDKMVDERVNEGQLSETPLTFQDLRAIKKTFLNILVGIYHSRVEYPDDEQEEEQDKQKQPIDSDEQIPRHPEPPESPPPVDEYYNS